MPGRIFGAALLLLASISQAGAATPPIAGTYALPDGKPKVSATLAAQPAAAGPVLMDIAMTSIGATRPLKTYDVELSKRLHLIAISADFRTFVHEHGDQPGPDGHFRVPMPLPHAGLWHVYADAVPTGLGQQVMRFDLNLGPDIPIAPAPPAPTGLSGADGRYAARFDALDLHAGQEAQLALHILRDGKPAPDVTPFLGVAAHAVFIDAADLTYIHVHAAPAAPMHHDMPGMAMPGMQDHAGMAGMGAALRPGAKVSPDLALHMTAPKPGIYLLWVQFTAGGQVRTVPFVVRVAS